MDSINTIEGLLFRSYLCRYNLSLLHKCIKAKLDDYENDSFLKSAGSKTRNDFKKAITRSLKNAEEYLDYCNKNNIQIFPHFDKNYPGQLLSIKDFPPLLFVKGNLPSVKCAAVVGTREVSPVAASKTDAIVKTFADYNYGIASGLAYGIDTLAHEAAIKYKTYTAAILPTELNRIYPDENMALANRILESGGALISEQAPFYYPVANPFVLRNRIQAALSDYTIPVEMGTESGTRHTIHYAFKYGRKLILCMPDSFEIDNFLSHYDGIIVAVKKYKTKENANVVLIRNFNDLVDVIKKDLFISQQNLF